MTMLSLVVVNNDEVTSGKVCTCGVVDNQRFSN